MFYSIFLCNSSYKGILLDERGRWKRWITIDSEGSWDAVGILKIMVVCVTTLQTLVVCVTTLQILVVCFATLKNNWGMHCSSPASLKEGGRGLGGGRRARYFSRSINLYKTKQKCLYPSSFLPFAAGCRMYLSAPLPRCPLDIASPLLKERRGSWNYLRLWKSIKCSGFFYCKRDDPTLLGCTTCVPSNGNGNLDFSLFYIF